MYLKSLESIGFKSFVEAKIEFPRGITAVVGPNGSGKSNVVDAILWVLGEQSTKTLRSERMEDVIFNGTQVRKPMGMAEVSLVIGGLQPGDLQGIGDLAEALRDYSDIMITRRLFRNGDSEYLINKTQCRLKDVRSVMLETRAGTKGHTIIAQGQLDHILNASPQARRELIEETAGIVHYKKQKAEALRKLESTQQNLVRLRDVIGEVTKQLSWLERQAQQARTYDALQREGRALEIRLLADDYRRLAASSEEIAADVLSLDTLDAEVTAEDARLQAAQQELRLQTQQQQDVVAARRQALATVEGQRAQALAQIDMERNRATMFEQQQAQALADSALYKEQHDRAQHEIETLRERVAELDGSLEEQAAVAEERNAELRERLAGKEQVAVQAQQARQALMQAAASQSEHASAVARLDTRTNETAARAARLATDQQDIADRQAALRQIVADLLRDRGELETRLQGWRTDSEAAGAEIDELGQTLSQLEQRRARDLEQLAATESRLRTLQAVVREEAGYGREGDEDGVSLRSCAIIGDAIAEWLVVPDGYERAVEGVLGERVRAWFVDDPRRAVEAVSFLKQRELGRATFVPFGQITEQQELSAEMAPAAALREAETTPAWWASIAGQPGVLGRAVEMVQGHDHRPAVLSALFHDVVFVQDVDAAVRLWEHGGWPLHAGPTLVTLAGEVLDHAGIMTGGLASASGGVLQRRRDVRHLEVRREELLAAIETARVTRETLVQQSEQAKARRRELDAQLREAEMKVLALSKDQGGSERNLNELAARAERLAAEAQSIESERATLAEQLETSRQNEQRAATARDEHEARLQELHQQQQAMEQDIAGVQEAATAAKLTLGSLRSSREHAVTTLSRLSAQVEDCTCRLGQLAETLAGVSESIQASLEARERHDVSCQQLGHEVDSLQSGLTELQEAVNAQLEAARTIEDELTAVRRRSTESRERRLDVEVRRAQVQAQLDTVTNTLVGTYRIAVGPDAEQLAQTLAQRAAAERLLNDAQGQTDLAMGDGQAVAATPQAAAEGEAVAQVEGAVEAAAEAPPAIVLEPAPVESLTAEEIAAMKARLQKIRDRLTRIGGVNLSAIDEHRELEERHRFLTSQEQDLTASIKSLRDIIQRINRTTKDLFHETFAQLQEKFVQVFQKVFPGGRAELIMVEPTADAEGETDAGADPGVDIVAQPPGKRLKNITMLSGGEKTLTAMALLIASFLIRPTPFCILDEIDAPLDEENIGRFTGVLRELAHTAQFIVITHNKRTMSIADSLFGVTMQEPGVSSVVSVRVGDLQPA
ncbi:MAG: AAA family ATPase [Nitrospiraceae bacterium]